MAKRFGGVLLKEGKVRDEGASEVVQMANIPAPRAPNTSNSGGETSSFLFSLTPLVSSSRRSLLEGGGGGGCFWGGGGGGGGGGTLYRAVGDTMRGMMCDCSSHRCQGEEFYIK